MMLMRLSNGPREHDYTQNMWGHALHSPTMVEVADPPKSLWQKWFGPRTTSQVLRALGHGSVRVGDTLLLKMESGRVARFAVREIEYYSNPDDMFDLRRADFVEYVGAASVDTHPKGGDAQQAPSLMGSAVGNAETPQSPPLSQGDE